MEKFEISARLISAIATYLGQKPHNEVAQLLTALQAELTQKEEAEEG
jgi:hypothetical protein